MLHVRGGGMGPHAWLVQGACLISVVLLLSAMPVSVMSAEREKEALVEDPFLTEPAETISESNARETANAEGKKVSDSKDVPGGAGQEEAEANSEKPSPAELASEEAANEGGVKEKAEKLDVGGLITRCIGSHEKLHERLEKLREHIGSWREKMRRELQGCHRQLALQKQQFEQEADVWRRMVSKAVKRWIERNANREGLRLLGCERLDELRLDVRGDVPVLVLSGRVRDPESIERRYEEVLQLFPDLELDTETLRGVAGECSLSIGRARVEEGSKVSMLDYGELPVSALSSVPTKDECASGRAGRELQRAIEEGKLEVEGGEVTDFWVSNDGDFALCVRSEGGWYVRESELEGFAGLFLGRRQ